MVTRVVVLVLVPVERVERVVVPGTSGGGTGGWVGVVTGRVVGTTRVGAWLPVYVIVNVSAKAGTADTRTDTTRRFGKIMIDEIRNERQWEEGCK